MKKSNLNEYLDLSIEAHDCGGPQKYKKKLKNEGRIEAILVGVSVAALGAAGKLLKTPEGQKAASTIKEKASRAYKNVKVWLADKLKLSNENQEEPERDTTEQ